MNIPTTTEIRDSIINSWELRLSVIESNDIKILRSLAKSALFILATAIAPVFRLIYLFILWALNQTDPQTADDENEVPGGRLQQWGRLVKVGEPKPGTAPRYEITITGTNGSVLPAGAAYRSSNENIYLLEADIVIVAGTATGIIKASVPEARENTEYALNVGAEVNTVNPFTGINNPAIIATELTAPVDSEDIEGSYRPRVVSNTRLAGAGGSRKDYKDWPKDGEGVQDAYPFADVGQPGVMDVYIEATTDIDPDGIPTQAVLDAAEEALRTDPETGLERKPATDYFFTLPISLRLFDIDVIGLIAPDILDAQEKITEATETYLENKKPFIDGAEPVKDKNDIVSRAELLAVTVATILPLGGTVDDIELELESVPIDTFRLDNGFKAKQGSIIFS